MDIQFKEIEGSFLVHHRIESAPPTMNLHYHDGYELYYFLGGERNYLTSNKIYPLNPDWITLTRPYVIHGTSGKHYERLLITFTEDFLTTYFQPTLIEVFHEVFSVETIPSNLVANNPQIKQLFYQIMENFNAHDMKMAALNLGRLLLVLYDAVKHMPNDMNSSNLSTQIQEILSYISNNLATIKTLEQVAEHFFVSKYYLSHQLKNCTGFTFIEFLTKAKLSRALYLLKHTKDSIAEISDACGFDNPSYFGIVFKKKLHMTPTQYRTWVRNKTNEYTANKKLKNT